MCKKELPSYPAVTPKNIWNFKQNHPELVVDDVKKYLGLDDNDCDILRTTLLARGVNKWLKVRRDLIAYKKMIKHDIIKLHVDIRSMKKELTEFYVSRRQVLSGEKSLDEFINCENLKTRYLMTKEMLKQKTQVRGDLKKLCDTERWQIWEGKKLKDMNTLRASD